MTLLNRPLSEIERESGHLIVKTTDLYGLLDELSSMEGWEIIDDKRHDSEVALQVAQVIIQGPEEMVITLQQDFGPKN